MLHKSAWETHARAEDYISSLSRQPDGFCIPNRLTTPVQKAVARIPISCVHDSLSTRTAALTKSI
jgi:hypothetical protein